jgi:gamma-glutamyltranspeptidase / glutathione hydrolase
MNGVGGGGYLVRHDNRSGDTSVVAFPMVAPRSARPGMFEIAGTGKDLGLFGWPQVVGGENIVGPRAVCVPGQVDGLALALDTWGSIDWRQALEPAIVLAEEGIPVTWHTSQTIARDLAALRRFPATAEIFCPDGIVPWSVTDESPTLLRQPDLAKTLGTLATEGPRSLYEGTLARAIISHLREAGIDFAEEDLASYRARIEPAISVSYGDHVLATMGRGSGGVTLAQSVALLDRAGVPALESGSVEALHLMAQAFALAFADRFAYLADPDAIETPYNAVLSAA